ncbi:DnaB-like helicase C-terminal domain-containing protein [Mycoplasmopsis meleagridis]|uniref:DnaB-like helicase C-terminal domain-containing protein n=1 Tax=Mycoplasmopsis meleagridis TaxID=29561 RepID=UPI00073D2F0B|nr:DnaB-like helicase C-terminal domain-containing protein [Mycoplasmopsis meleagridis]KUH47515.1 hypothetical protein ASB56_00040 [Mycoplasmopsis meleagridis]
MTQEEMTKAAVKNERNLLALILLRQENSHEIIPYLTEEDFFDNRHSKLFTIMKYLFDNAKSINEDSILDTANKMNYEDMVDEFFLAEVYTANAFIQNLEDYRTNLINFSTIRKLFLAFTKVNNYFFNNSNPQASEMLTLSQELVKNIESNDLTNDFPTSSDEQKTHFLRLKDENNQLVLKTNYKILDYVTKGFFPGEIVVIAARPGEGKTTFSLNLLLSFVLQDKPSLFLSLEMPTHVLQKQIYQAYGGITAKEMQEEFELSTKFQATKEVLTRKTYNILEPKSFYLNQIVPLIEKHKKKFNTQVVFIDYLQLIRGTAPGTKGFSRHTEIEEILGTLKYIAKTLNITIFILSQLGRDIQKRANGNFYLSDLRDSGSIEATGDKIMFLSLDHSNPNSNIYPMSVHILKNRTGPHAKIPFVFSGDIATVTEYHERN